MLRYLSLALVCAAIALLLAKSEADTSAQYYPRFHPRPRTNWINDPNGPVYFNGVYHLFTQYNPWGSVWGNMSWAHLVSYDLVYWIEQPVAMFNDKWYDVQGVFSGSASILNDGSIALTYTCVGNDTLQRQCLAFPKDPTDRFLQEWVKFEGNPVINDAPPGASLQNVRDDTTAWTQNGKYAMTAGTVIDDQGYAWLYHSSDFKNWTTADHPLFTDQTPTGMWECPDFFPISDLDNPNSNSVFVFKVSANSQDWYRLGHFDTNAEVFVPFSNSSSYQLYDLGRMYASKRFHDPVGKRQILWGWVWEEYDEAAFMTWQGIQSLPRVLSYDWKNQRLAVAPLPGLTSLRDRESEFSESVSLSPDSNFEASAAAWNSAQFEALLEANITQCLDAETGCTFGLNLLTSSDGTETTVVSISINEPMKALQGQSISIQGGSQIAEVALDPSHSVEAQVYACQMMCTVSEQCSTWTYSPDVSAYPSRSSKKYDLGEKFPNYKVGRPKSSIAFGPYCFLNSGDISITSQIVTAGCPNCVTSLEYNGSPNPILVVDRAASGVGSTLAWVAVLPPIFSDTMRVRAFVDHSVIETFVDDATSIITRVYPRNADSTSWNVFYQSNGGDNLPVKISSWKLLDAVV